MDHSPLHNKDSSYLVLHRIGFTCFLSYPRNGGLLHCPAEAGVSLTQEGPPFHFSPRVAYAKQSGVFSAALSVTESASGSGTPV